MINSLLKKKSVDYLIMKSLSNEIIRLLISFQICYDASTFLGGFYIRFRNLAAGNRVRSSIDADAAWLTDGVPVHPEGVWWGWGQSLWRPVVPHQVWKTFSRRTSLCVRSHCHHKENDFAWFVVTKLEAQCPLKCQHLQWAVTITITIQVSLMDYSGSAQTLPFL